MATNAHRLGPLPVAFWRGDQPQFAHQRTVSHTRAGANGIGRTLLGRWGRRFTSELEFHSATYPTGLAVITAVLNMTGRAPQQVVFNRVPLWVSPFRHNFLVTSARLVRATKRVRIIGPNYNFPSGTAVVIAIEFEPFPLF